MPSESQPLLPVPGQRGLSSYPPDRLLALVLPAWDAFIGVAEDVDLDGPTRCPDWTARALLAHLGSFPDARLLGDALDEARQGLAFDLETGTVPQDDRNRRRVAAHADAPREALLSALRQGRDDLAELLASPDARALATAPVPSAVGPLPLFGLVAAMGYELAVHALDLVPAGAPSAPPVEVLRAGLAALVDTTGALAGRTRVETTFALITPEATWAAGAVGPDWTTLDVAAPTVDWPAVEGSARAVLDVSAGRASAPALLLTRELRVHRPAGLLELAPVLEGVPGLPGGPALKAAARYLGGVGRLVRRLPLPGLG